MSNTSKIPNIRLLSIPRSRMVVFVRVITIFQINHVCVRGMSSEQVAGILRQCSHQVRLVVARSVREPTNRHSEITSTNYVTTYFSYIRNGNGKQRIMLVRSSTTPSLLDA